MKWTLWFLSSFFFLMLSSSSAFAAEDFIAPTKISFIVQPGEELSYDLVYKSGMGGTYDLSSRPFRYSGQGAKEFFADASEFVLLETTVFEFQPGEEKQLPIRIVIPESISDQDVYISHFLRRRTAEQQTFELGSLMFLRIGQIPDFKGRVSNVQFHERDQDDDIPQAGFHSITFDFLNESGRYFAIIPTLQLLNEAGGLLRTFENQPTYVFPEFKKSVNVFNFSDRDLSLNEPGTKAVLTVFSESKSVLYEEELTSPKNGVFLAQSRKESPFQGVRIRKGFLYHPIFQFSAIVIGLTLIGFSFFMKKK